MGTLGCSIDGNLNTSKFSEPIPWIGLYVAAASLACTLAMASDAHFGVKRRKLWFPCRRFSLNATSLALLTIATKLPVDLNTSMPRRQDQLAKLTGTVLICTAMGNFMPSLGNMEESEMLMNLVALCILVVTVVVNIGIQMGTGVIYAFIPEHAGIMFLMLVLLVVLVSSAIAAPTMKQLLEQQFKYIHRTNSGDGSEKDSLFEAEKIKEDLKKYWVMAGTCNPQYVVGRSAMSTASGALCLLAALILVEAVVRSLVADFSYFCHGESDYKWSTMLIVVCQGAAIVVGTVAPALRWFNAVKIKNLHRGKGSWRDEFRVETWWVQRFLECKEKTWHFGINSINSRHGRKIAYIAKQRILDLLIQIQIGVVLMSKSVRLASILTMCTLKRLMSAFCCQRISRKLEPNGSFSKDAAAEAGPASNRNLAEFVLHLEGEDELIELIARNGCDAVDRWLQKASKNQPTYLIDLLRKSTALQGFRGIGEFDSNQIPSFTWAEPPNCWALPVVTLTSIAVALPNADQNRIKPLRRGVNEGLRIVRLIEKELDAKGSAKMREAAESVWLGVDIYNCWLNEKLGKFSLNGKCSKKAIEQLVESGKKFMLEFTDGIGKKKDTLECPLKILAANSMCRIGQTILQNYDNFGTDNTLFTCLEMKIADILAACFANLPHVISMKCTCRTIEARASGVVEAAYLFGEAQTILATLRQQELPNLGPNQMVSLDEWCLRKEENPSCFLPTFSDDSIFGFNPGELSLCIE